MQQSLGRYLSGIERNLEQMGERLQRTETKSEPDDRVAEALRDLAARIAAVENRESAAPRESGAGKAVTRIEDAVESAVPSGVLDMAEFRLTAAAPFAPEPESAPAPEAAPLMPQSDAAHSRETIRDSLRREAKEVQPARASAEDYLAQARRAVRGIERNTARSMRHRSDVPVSGETGMRRRFSQRVSMALVFLLLIAAGFMLTRAIQSRADVLAFNSSNLIALAAPVIGVPPAAAGASATAPSSSTRPVAAAAIEQPAKAAPAASGAPADSVASASILPLGTARDTAVAQLKAKAIGGDAKASMSLGLKYADGDGVPTNDTEAFYWLQKAADAGEPVAQYRLGTLYERGRGVPADVRQALRWYGEAAKRGNRRAMHNLAVVYADGAAEARNFPEALHWFKDAAELGLTDSQFNLAVLYERGLGVKPSLAEAYKWYEIAAASGDSESKTRLAALTNQIAPADRDAADKAARAYRPRPIDSAANEG
jgi:localization factor PodJL